MTARRIEPGKTEEFIEKFGAGPESIPEEIREKFKAVYACRDVKDPDVILTFGLFDGTIDEFRALQAGEDRGSQLESIDPLVNDVLIDGSYEVLHEFVSEFAASSTA
jgi:hypothetical protein